MQQYLRRSRHWFAYGFSSHTGASRDSGRILRPGVRLKLQATPEMASSGLIASGALGWITLSMWFVVGARFF
jgi:hypothetical protein